MEHFWDSSGLVFHLYHQITSCKWLILFNGSALLLRKQQLATEYNRKHVLQHHFTEWQHWHHQKQVLRHHFTEWQHWNRAENLKRELALTKEETRKKMDELLKAASVGKLSAPGSVGTSLLKESTAMVEPPTGEVLGFSFA